MWANPNTYTISLKTSNFTNPANSGEFSSSSNESSPNYGISSLSESFDIQEDQQRSLTFNGSNQFVNTKKVYSVSRSISAVGTPVYAAVSGVVVHSGPNKFLKGWGRSFGIHVIVDNDKFKDGSAGLWAGYCHLSKVKVPVGKRVKKGQLLGYAGSTGNSTAPHLHFQILSTRHWSPTKHVNPSKWLKA
jgi:murein DD-endopeptidase MepM/ murein hydrolase activator NlpD